MSQFSDQIIQWHHAHGRHDMPWQNTKDPYRIWVSEIMLQQTQVSTVIPYYERFMQQFPNVNALANAHIDEVLHLWTGLGYYARGRNLHKAAQMVVNDFGGNFPKTIEEMMSLPGIGRSTAGAILSFAFSLRHPILDGNVKRVLSRAFGVEGWYGKSTVAAQLWELAEEHTPNDNVDIYTQAIMDFGATLCKRSKPLCEECQIKPDCIAFQENRIHELPGKKPKKTIPTKQCQILVIRNEDQQILLKKRPPTGIWGGLWSFPQYDKDQDLIEVISSEFGIEEIQISPLEDFKHTFSHYHLHIFPIQVQLKQDQLTKNLIQDDESLWITMDDPLEIGLPTPIKQLIEKLQTK